MLAELNCQATCKARWVFRAIMSSMFEWHPLARLLILGGVALVIAGVAVQMFTRISLPFSLGRLPGDIIIERDNFTLYIPLGTMILVSLGLTLLLNLIARLFNSGR